MNKPRRICAVLRSWIKPLASVALLSFSLLLGAAMAQSADLVLNHSGSPDPGPAGGIFTYTLRIDNNGPDAASAVTLGDMLPPGSQFVDATPTAGTCPTVPAVGAAGFVACTLGNLPFISFVSVAIRVRLPTVGVYS